MGAFSEDTGFSTDGMKNQMHVVTRVRGGGPGKPGLNAHDRGSGLWGPCSEPPLGTLAFCIPEGPAISK